MKCPWCGAAESARREADSLDAEEAIEFACGSIVYRGGGVHADFQCQGCKIGCLASRLAQVEAERDAYRLLAVSYGSCLSLSEGSVESIIRSRLAAAKARKEAANA